MLLGKTYSPLQLLKPANYEISKTRKYKNDIGKIENMEHDKISDFYTCKNNSKLTVSHIRHNKTKTGHAVQKIPKQRDCECTRLKYSFSNCKKHINFIIRFRTGRQEHIYFL